ncbi:hypothetical protein LSTR_LSTR000408 [Laodelphax striatellus]|uniref:Large ribosomal subunit protein mL50 n=1 Tax=Laodelphax striatellus TaxID=195883 RepID=A0A482X3T2_LAOST|nr:hypothetical protein LSTR_LSTR000408 [Laodelphax striatellus]
MAAVKWRMDRTTSADPPRASHWSISITWYEAITVMAALIKHVLSKTCCRSYSTNFVPGAKLRSAVAKISARGFLRNLKEYKPPDDVNIRVSAICERILGNENSKLLGYKLTDPNIRYKLFTECFNEFKHGIPNSLLFKIVTVDDLHNFYETPVDTTAPYDALKNRTDLPENLYLQPDYVRFHPDTDVMFKGKSVFPKSSLLVTGLRTRKKYKGFTTKSPYDYDIDK